MNHPMNAQKWLLVIVLLGLGANIVFLYVLLFRMRNDVQQAVVQLRQQTASSTAVVENKDLSPDAELTPATSSTSAVCPSACLAQISELRQLFSSITPGNTSNNSSSLTNVSSEPLAKEFSVQFGTGKSQAKDWEDIAGLNAYINSSNYQRIKSVQFEASLRIPTANGTVYARLFNKTDGHPVWNSDVSSETNVSALKQSAAVTLDAGNKLYQVQMKTTLGYESIIDSARIKIILE